MNRWASPFGQLAVGVDWRVYVVGLGFTLVSALLFGLVPARQAWRSSPLQGMKGGESGDLNDTIGLRRFALRDLLLGAQIAICTLLITASLVAVRGMEKELHAPLGFKPQGAMLADIDLSQIRDAGDGEQLSEAAQDAEAAKEQVQIKGLLDAVRGVAGVTAAGFVSRTPMTGGMRGVPIFAPGTTEFKLKNSVLAPYVFQMTPGYLEAAGTRLVRGRDVSWHDTAATPHVAVVNEAFVAKMNGGLWGGDLSKTGAEEAAAIGRRFVVAGKLTEVVGIAEDGKYHDLQESSQPVVYLPEAQSESGESILVVRSPRTPREMTEVLTQTLRGIVPDAPISVASWQDSLDGELFPARAAAVALGIMGMLAAMLAVTGIFGMAAYSVSRRMKELGIRVALGARRVEVMRAAIGRPIFLLAAGSALGLFMGLLASRLLGQIVYQADTGDPVVLLSTVFTMVLLGVVASAIPARRALAVDPSRLMRDE